MAEDTPKPKFDPRTHNPDGTIKSFKGMMGGARPNSGRPPGSPNSAQKRFKDLARSYTDPAMRELARIAGLLQRVDPKTNELLFKSDGTPDMVPGSLSDGARATAIGMLLERGWGKAVTKIAGGDEGDNPIQNRHEHIRTERVIVGTGNPDAANGVGAPSNEAQSDPDVDEEEKRA